MSLLFKNYCLVEVIYLLIRLLIKTKSFLRNIKNTDTNGVIEQNTHSYTAKRIILERVI